MDDERLEKIRKEFDRRFTVLPERDKIMKMEFDDAAKFTGSDVAMSVRATLEKDFEGKERIFNPGYNLVSSIYSKINFVKKDIEKIKQSKLLARVHKPGDPILNEKKFETKKFYPVRNVKRIEDMQSKQGKKTVTYTILTQLNYSFDLVLDGDYNVAMVLVADQNLETTIQMSNQEARIEELHNKFKALKDKCRNLLQEYAKRLNTSMKEWSEEKAMKYEQLKLNYHRCVERLRQIYFPQAQGIGED